MNSEAYWAILFIQKQSNAEMLIGLNFTVQKDNSKDTVKAIKGKEMNYS